jgi:vancomycin resistance protein YoaR
VTDRPTASTDSDLPLGFAVSPEPEKPARRRRRWWVVGIVVTVLVLGGLYLAAYLYAGTTIPRGTTVLGIDLGGQTRQEAEATLAAELPAIADAPVTLLVQQDGYPIVPSESGLNVDVTATVRAAGPGASDPIRLIEVITGGGGPVDPVVVVDESALAAAIDDVADEADRDPVEGRVRFDAGEVVATLPEEGREVERDTSVDLVAESYLTQSAPIALPYEVTVPAVSEDEVTRAVEEFAEPAMSGPVPLRSALGSSQLDTDLLSRVVSMRADDDGVLQPRIDSEALLELSGDQLDELGRPPVDAAVRIQGGAPVVVPGQTGRAPDTSPLRRTCPGRGPADRRRPSRAYPAGRPGPDYTTADARDSGVRQVIAEFTTSYPHADYRNINIGRAAELATNTFLKPGDVFSMNGVVGERTEARGFTTGFIIDNGRFMEGVGGGVSQLATTLFNAGHFAGFEDVEHHPHSFYIDRYPGAGGDRLLGLLGPAVRQQHAVRRGGADVHHPQLARDDRVGHRAHLEQPVLGGPVQHRRPVQLDPVRAPGGPGTLLRALQRQQRLRHRRDAHPVPEWGGAGARRDLHPVPPDTGGRVLMRARPCVG